MELPALLAAEAESGGLIQTELTVVILLTTAALIAVVTRWIKLPFTVALVLAGLAFTFVPDFLQIEASPELILGLLVPPLLFEATLHISWPKLRADLAPILGVAIVGTLIGTFLVAAIVEAGADVPWMAAIAFGALISATDPVAVIAFFKTLGVSKRLAVLVEGESLFNDAVAVVLFSLAVNAAAEGTDLSVGLVAEQFVIVGFGGLAVGCVLGYIVSSVVLKNVDDHLVETGVTLALAYGSFIVAEQFGEIFGIEDLHFSGILAVVSAGLLVGNVGLENTSPTTRRTLENFWEFLTFLVNSIVFLLLGITVDVTELQTGFAAVVLAVLAIIVTRLVIVYGVTSIHGLLQPRKAIPWPFRHVAYWGGLRGAISLALALSLADSVFSPDTVQTLREMTFGVVLFTLVVQGTTISGLINRLGLAGKGDAQVTQERHQARLIAGRAGRQVVERLGVQGVLFPSMSRAMSEVYEEEIRSTSGELGRHFRSHPELEITMLLQARRNALAAEQNSFSEIGRKGLVSGDVVDELSAEHDRRIVALDTIAERWDSDPSAPLTEVDNGG
ncbi:MAG: sodium:proton antiporter [Actinomycetota bacterium]|nr:sodium:proton antiporter [Actinomycetota bacterium]